MTIPHPPLEPEMARALMEIAHRASGVSLGPAKLDFVRGRLAPRLMELGCADYPSYLRLLSGPDGATERQRLAEALATHTTSFFRERRHYDWLAAEGLAQFSERGIGVDRDLVVWSAACSTGAELWSAAMVVHSFSGPGGGALRWQGIGSDISVRILERTRAAVFSEEEVEGVPPDFRHRFLMRSRPGPDPNATAEKPRFRIVPELRKRCRLLQLNLLALDQAPSFQADIVFLRNVLIYFSAEDQLSVATAVVRRMSPGGILFTGHAETLRETIPGLIPISTAIYQRSA